jgi:ATP-dependent DNA helicase RecG
LTAKGHDSDTLLMSATPIPRTLMMTAYGDLDVSRLVEKPPGRRPVDTRTVPLDRFDEVSGGVARALAGGAKVFWVCPMVEESETTDIAAAEERYRALAELLPGRVGLVHGRMKSAEKDRVMAAFAAGQAGGPGGPGAMDLLVATTVIEVGIDVPNATVMLIEHPERFGLSQLHQLRGRVGRGAEESYCILLGDVSPDVSERLQIFARSEDGFEIAREDLRLRGMGDLFGERQSGVPTFRIADPLRDEELNDRARAAAAHLLTRDSGLERPEHAGLRRVLGERYARSLELFRVG